jgi:tripartite-type tricarboxylate transporter receptor subunit TctC
MTAKTPRQLIGFIRTALGALIGVALLLAATVPPARAQYPARAVHIVLPLAAGGSADVVARIIAPVLAERLGQPVLVENKPGADGALAGQAVAMSPPDGYTLLYAITATAALPLVAKTSFDMRRDFTPISTLGTYDFGMFVSTLVPATTIQQLVEYVKARPGQLNFATLNTGEFLAASLFMRASGTQMVRVPYKAMAQILPDMVSGQVQVNFGPLSNGMRFAKEGRMKVLASLGAERSAFAPNIPTLREAGYPDVNFESVQMIFAPAKTPLEIVERLSREVNAVLQQPDVRERLEQQSLRVRGSSPAAMAKELEVSYRDWERFAKENQLQTE